MRTLFVITLLALLVLPIGASAEVQIITATHTYVMGDRDSKEEARALCYMTAKRKALEKAGSFIQSPTEVNNLQLTGDQITSYSTAILSAEVVKEEFGFKNGINTLTLTVKAVVDIADVQKRLAAIVADKSLQVKIEAQQQQIRQLEQQVQALNERLGGAAGASEEKDRKKRGTELLTYYRLGAERGEAEAQNNLGLAYANGDGVPQDSGQAVAWYRQAAERGYFMGQLF